MLCKESYYTGHKPRPDWILHTSRHIYDVALLLNTEIVHFVKGKLHFSKVPNTYASAKRPAGLAAGLAGIMVFYTQTGSRDFVVCGCVLPWVSGCAGGGIGEF